MQYLRRCLICPEMMVVTRKTRKTCSGACRLKLMRRLKANDSWQDELSIKAGKALDELQLIKIRGRVQKEDMFDKAMMLGNVHGSQAANGFLEIIQDCLTVFSIY